MGNNSTIQSQNIQDIFKNNNNIWYLGIEHELQKLGYTMNVRTDRFHKTNFFKLYQIKKPQHQECITLSTAESLFATQLENMKRSKRNIDPKREYTITTLVQEYDSNLQEFEKQVLEQLSTLQGCLLEIFQTFRLTQLPKISQEMDTQIIKFRDSYVKILIHYYDLNHFAQLNQCEFLNTSSLQCLVTNMIFNEHVASHVYEIKKQEQIYLNEQIHKKSVESANKTLADFGISIKYCLDCTTREYIQTKLSSKNNNTSNSQNLSQQRDIYETIIIEEFDTQQIPSRPQAKLLQGTFFLQTPFEKAIDALKLLQFRQTPHHKVKQLIVCFNLITRAIIDYYQQYDLEAPNMSTDEMISIFHYILCKSKLQNPYTHFDIMQKYLGNLDGVEGVYLTIMEATFSI